MKRFLTTTALVLAGVLTIGTTADARPYNHHYDRGYHGSYHGAYHGADRGGYSGARWHDRSDWRRGGYVARYDWDRGYGIDYRRYHLRRPPVGYEWRRVGNNYVLAAVASGLIASIILNN